MKECRTCKWYSRKDDYRCTCPKMVYGYGDEDIAADQVAIEDDAGWGMSPGPEFGCVHHSLVEGLGNPVEYLSPDAQAGDPPQTAVDVMVRFKGKRILIEGDKDDAKEFSKYVVRWLEQSNVSPPGKE